MPNAVEEFFKRVLPTSGWFYVAAITGKGAKHKGYPVQEAEKARQWAEVHWQSNQYSVYFTPCTWTQQYVKNDEGKNKNCRKRQDLVHRLRALWLDIDSQKQGKTVREVVTELAKFCTQVGLPLPNVIVETGGGVHAYWTFDDELTLTQWQPLAEALKQACIAHKFTADHVCTADHARILRIPGSINFKYKDKPVSKLKRLEPHVSFADCATVLSKFRLPTGDADAHINDEFSGGRIEYEPGKIELVVKECPLFAEIHANGGATCSEPLWKGMLHICAHAEDGQTWAHTLSKNHQGYSPLATDRKLAACDISIPPTRCTTLEAAYGAGAPCIACPHHGKIKGPLVLGRDISTGSIKAPDGLPDGYFMSSSGIFRRTKTEGEQGIEKVCQVPIIDLQVQDMFEYSVDDAKIVPNLLLTFADANGGVHKGTIPMHVLPDYRATYTALSGIKFPYMRSDHKNGFDTLMTSWVQRLRETGKVTTGKPQFGWHMKSSSQVDGFAIGKTMYLPDGTTKQMMWPDTQLNHIYTTEGSIYEWKKAVELLTRRNRPELMTLVAGAFAAPLFTFLGESSAVVSAVSRESGVGKSSAMKVAQAVWGDPKAGVTSLDDTAKSVARKMGVIKNLPVFWDELRLTDDTAQDFLQMMFQLSQGREKTRLTATVEFREAGTWETILVCAGNSPLINFAYDANTRTNANLKRLFEYEIKYDGETPRSADGTKIFNSLRHNYGHAGVEYVRFLVSNTKQVENDVQTLYRALYDQLGARNEDRFWIGTITTLLLGAKYAKQLNLVPFDLGGLQRFLCSVYIRMQRTEEEVVEHSIGVRVLTDFLREQEGYGLVYGGNHLKAIDKDQGRSQLLRVPADSRQGVMWEYYASSGRLRILRQPLQDFLKRQRVARNDFFKDLADKKYCPREIRTSFGAGTRYEGITKGYAYEMDVPKSDRSSLGVVNAVEI